MQAQFQKLEALAQYLVESLIPAMDSFLADAQLGVPGMHLQFIACGLLSVTAVRKKFSNVRKVGC